jgi:hypothetical protein
LIFFDNNFLFVGGSIRISVLYVMVILATKHVGCGTNDCAGGTLRLPSL